MSEKPAEDNPQTSNLSGFVRALSEPLSKHGWPSWLVYVLSGFGVLYILNPTLGILEFIPDNLPIIGNLDESVAVMLVLSGIVEALEGKKHRKAKKQREDETKEKIVKTDHQT
ncbi:MAG: DUF1232 domain-containing protein [Chloroflexota bacterium]|jgi:uncharacterized membrane protein YkvA (DUF1232 family)|nr:DUF1232 domain-containing protein [Chloroflexota bacterium]